MAVSAMAREVVKNAAGGLAVVFLNRGHRWVSALPPATAARPQSYRPVAVKYDSKNAFPACPTWGIRGGHRPTFKRSRRPRSLHSACGGIDRTGGHQGESWLGMVKRLLATNSGGGVSLSPTCHSMATIPSPEITSITHQSPSYLRHAHHSPERSDVRQVSSDTSSHPTP